MATQNYLLNQPFNTLSIDELNTQDNNAWTWEGRTLVGYVSADNYENIIPVGSEFVHGEQTGELQGVWELNKLHLSVFIENAGPDSYVEISAATLERPTKSNEFVDHVWYSSRPLTDEEQITEITAHNGEIIDFWYASRLICHIHAGNNHTISCVCWDTTPNNNMYNKSLYFGNLYTTYSCYGEGNGLYYGVTVDKTLSVILVEGGIMTYSNNKFTLNPKHSAL